MPSSSEACLLCSAKCVPNVDYIEIFSNDVPTESDLHIASLAARFLDKELKPDPSSQQLLCKKCFTLITELQELQNRVAEIKNEILEPTSSVILIKEEDEDKDNLIHRKMLFIPSSDDDSTQVMEKNSFEELSMELADVEGADVLDNPEGDTSEMVIENIEYHNFSNDDEGEILDAGAIDQSSDSDYDPMTGSLKPATFVKINMNTNSFAEVNLKLEAMPEEGPMKTTTTINDNKKPIILRKKISTVPIEFINEDKKSESTALPVVSKEGDIYTCLLCEGDETVAGESKAIVAHVKDVHRVRLYICDVCGQDFCKRNQLSAHLDEHVAAEEGDFQCEICNRIFSNLRLFRIHKRMHYPQNKSWVCHTCGKKYSSKNLLDEHVNTHLGLRPYICEICGKDFASKYTYKAHEKTHEIRPRPFKCSQCQKSFLSQQNLTQHERTHLGMKEFSCQLCGKQFGSEHNLEVHSIVHTGYKPFVCGLCGKAFARKAEIRDHDRTHTGERPYQCEFCGATFSQRSNLQSHKRATHYDDKRYQCNICGKGFKRRRLLDYHNKAVHTGERPFKCEICEATFVYPEHFKKHRRIHTGEKPFLCEVCGKAFNSRDNRNAHRFVHSDKKPYECLVCGAGFMRKPLLYQHMQSQGHQNDTIVVNQPRLTINDEQIVAVNADGEMEIFEGTAAGGKYYIQDTDGTEHIFIDRQDIHFAEIGSDDDSREVKEEVEAVTGEQTDDGVYEEIVTGSAIASGETQIIETPEGPIQLVKVRIPNDDGEEEEAWIKIVPE